MRLYNQRKVKEILSSHRLSEAPGEIPDKDPTVLFLSVSLGKLPEVSPCSFHGPCRHDTKDIYRQK